MEAGMAMATTPQKVLVVEDDASMREAVERILGLAGFEPRTYVSAEALLAAGAAEGAACVVSDLRLPAMSGLELLVALRARGFRAPLVLITAYDEPGLAEEATRLGAARYLAKPFHGTELLAAVRAVIGAGDAR
jgi:FixJ family two-component response regulator